MIWFPPTVSCSYFRDDGLAPLRLKQRLWLKLATSVGQSETDPVPFCRQASSGHMDITVCRTYSTSYTEVRLSTGVQYMQMEVARVTTLETNTFPILSLLLYLLRTIQLTIGYCPGEWVLQCKGNPQSQGDRMRKWNKKESIQVSRRRSMIMFHDHLRNMITSLRRTSLLRNTYPIKIMQYKQNLLCADQINAKQSQRGRHATN